MPSHSTKSILLDAADIVERGWTKGANARRANGEACSPMSADAVCWCVRGAVFKAAHGHFDGQIWPAFDALDDSLGGDGHVTWNDMTCWSGEQAAEQLRKAAAGLSEG